MEEKKSFETLLEETRTIVEKLNDPEITLEEAVKLYETGLSEIKEAQKLLEEAKAKIRVIEQSEQRVDDA
jgi:exodeoxyribonuclease VII small subunit